MKHFLSRLRTLPRDRRGAATIEFAFWSILFFMGMLVALDFAMWRTQQLRLGSAIEQGGVLAFNARQSLNADNATAIGNYVRTAAQVAGGWPPDVTVTCNEGLTCSDAADRPCACLNMGASGPAFPAAACGSSCAATPGTTAGYYVKIKASHPYQSAILPSAMLAGKMMVDSVVVRLQ